MMQAFPITKPVLTLTFFFFLASSSQAESFATRDPVTNARELTRQELSVADFGESLEISKEAISTWKENPDFLEMERRIREHYSRRATTDLLLDLHNRRDLLVYSPDPDELATLAIAASTIRRFEAAEGALRRAIEISEGSGNPFHHYLLGRILAEQDLHDEAVETFHRAVSSATDSKTKFRIRYHAAQDLFRLRNLQAAHDFHLECLQSSDPIEKGWALYELSLYEWQRNDRERVNEYRSQIERLIDNLPADPVSEFEKRRIRHIHQILAFLKGAAEGDQISQLCLDEESGAYEIKREDYQAVKRRLEKWVVAYPLVAAASHEPLHQRFIIDSHTNYSTALFFTGSPDLAADGFLDIIESVSPEQHGKRVVDAWCWRGYCLKDIPGREEEALDCYETGLALDAADVKDPYTPTGLLQMRVGGKTSDDLRASYVLNYAKLLDRVMKDIHGDPDWNIATNRIGRATATAGSSGLPRYFSADE